METKVCTKCGIEKPLGEYYLEKRASGRYYRKSACQTCIKEYKLKWRQINSDRIKHNNRRLYLKYKEREKIDAGFAEHRKSINARSCKKWQSKNKEYLAEYKWRIGNTVKGKAMKLEADRRYREKLKTENPNEYSERVKKRNEMKRVGLRNVYVVYLIKRRTGLSTEQIRQHPELIETKRQTIKIKRLCRTLQN